MTQIILHVGDPKETLVIRKALEKRGQDFRIVFTSDGLAVETSFGIIRGYENIVMYLGIETS